MCPTSNIDTKIYKNYKEHSIKKMYDNNLNITVNTDNRTVSNITLTEEYEKLVNAFNFDLNDLKNMNVNAIKASFMNTSEKEILKKKYDIDYNNFIKKLDCYFCNNLVFKIYYFIFSINFLLFLSLSSFGLKDSAILMFVSAFSLSFKL